MKRDTVRDIVCSLGLIIFGVMMIAVLIAISIVLNLNVGAAAAIAIISFVGLALSIIAMPLDKRKSRWFLDD